MHIQLQPGTILDERYRIDAVLGQGGFGITYAAENIRVGLKVAIKELFWREHCLRSNFDSPEIALTNAADAPVFEEQKQRFLREARTIRDFSGHAGVVGILDYFEANNTAYIVMEYVEGETLSARFAASPLPCEELLRQFLPIVDTLGAIHKAGVIHRDISPDNIMIQPDGSLKLIDFGAARQYQSDNGRFTAISRDSYSPAEQYDKNGRQGPWTDVYALCATLYACVCGAPPQEAIQRIFLDELKTPSQLGVSIKPAYESIIMRGLQLRPEKRWQSMDDLAKAIRAALPAEKPVSNKPVIAFLAGLLCVALVLGIWGWRRYDETHKFRGIETEQIRFEATEDTTASEFAAAQVELGKRLDDFAGEDNYILNVDGDSLWVTVPLESFDNRDIPVVLHEQFNELIPGRDIHWWYDCKADWEDPAFSMFAGKNQVLPEQLKGPQMIYAYTWSDSLTAGQRANLIVDFKSRLDALDAPYAFGTAYGNKDVLVYQIGLDRAGPFIENTLRTNYPLCIGNEFYRVNSIESSDLLKTEEGEDGALVMRYVTHDEYSIKALETYTRDMLEAGLDTIYLMDQDDRAIACTTITEPVTDGTLIFSKFCLAGIESLDAQNRWLSEYFDTLLYQTKLPTNLSSRGWEYIDDEGNRLLDNINPEYGLKSLPSPERNPTLHERLSEICREYGYEYHEGNTSHFVLMDLKPDETFAEEIKNLLPEIVKKLQIDHELIWKSLIFCLIDESRGNKIRFAIFSTYYYDSNLDSGRFKTAWTTLAIGKPATSLYDTVDDWFEAYDWTSLGLERN